jgi:hypothetical protein
MERKGISVRDRIDEINSAAKEIASVDLGAGKDQLLETLAAETRLLGTLNDLREVTEANIGALKRVLSLFADELLQESTALVNALPPLSSLPKWRQARAALAEARQFLSAKELVQEIVRIGGDPGKEPLSAVYNGAKTHPEVFVQKKDGGKQVFGLREWEEKGEGENNGTNVKAED